jgi:hypothetical protein
MELWADLTEETQPVEKIEEVKEVPATQTTDNSDIKVVFNSEKNGIELYFTEKPVAELRNKLKENGFRYHSQKVCWYAKDNEEIRNLLINENILIVEPEEVAEIKEMNISIDELNEISIIENVEVIEDNGNKINNNELKEVENMDSLELRKCDFGYCTDYKEGDNCTKCSELTKAKGYTGCVYATMKENIKIVQETSIVEELKQESETVINSINTESLETQKASLKAVSNQLDKIYDTIQENLDNEEIRLQLRDIENDLKWSYGSLDEMIEKQTMPDANDFNNIETLKTVYITNWNELPEEIQNYILSCDKYWIDLQEIILYHNNKAVASIGISGHHKHNIEVNSIGVGELFQWNTTDGYTLNNLEVSVDNEPTQQPEIIINEQLAKRAKENMSFSDYKEGSATESYNKVVEEMTLKINQAKEEVKDDSEKQSQLDYLLNKFKKDYANWINKKNANGASHVSWMISGRGNYNMNKHNKYVAREDKLWQEYNNIMDIDSKINKIINGNKIIRTDDKNALEKLRAKLEQEQKTHDEMVSYNKQARKENKEVYPTYMITNSNQRIKNIKDRIAQLEKFEELKKIEPSKEIEINGVKIIDNLEANRLQMIFNGKPDENIRKLLKSNGFRWSPSNGAWQRYRSYEAERKAKIIAESLNTEDNIAM